MVTVRMFSEPDTQDDADSADSADEAVASPRAQQRLASMLQQLRDERVGPSDSEKWFSLAGALATPVARGQGRLGQVLGNVSSTLGTYEAQKREAENAKRDLIAKYELGLAQVEDRNEAARLRANRRRTAINPVSGALQDLDTGEVIGAGGVATRFSTGSGATLMEAHPNLKNLDPNQLYSYDAASGEAKPMKVEAEKPTLPAQALARQNTLIEQAGQLVNTADEAQRLAGLVTSGELKLGPVENLASKGKLAAGLSDPNAENYASLERFVNASVNSILNIAKGPQTEGDARRAQRQILRNLNDPKAVAAGLAELRRLMLKEVGTRDAQLHGIYQNYNVEPTTLWDAMGVEAPADYTAPAFRERAAGRGAAPPTGASRSRADAIRRILEERRRAETGQ